MNGVPWAKKALKKSVEKSVKITVKKAAKKASKEAAKEMLHTRLTDATMKPAGLSLTQDNAHNRGELQTSISGSTLFSRCGTVDRFLHIFWYGGTRCWLLHSRSTVL